MTMPKHGEFCWTEIATKDLQTAQEFYQNVFGWNFKCDDEAEEWQRYPEFSLPDEPPMGGMLTISGKLFGEGELPPPHLLNYVVVENVDESALRSADLGATVVKPPMDIPEVGRFCLIRDPAGAFLALLTLKGESYT